VAIEIAPETPLQGEAATPVGGVRLTTVDSGALRLLACAALAVLAVCLLILPAGPSESDETMSWVLAFAVALPFGLALAAYQARLLAAAAPAAAARGVAAGTMLLAAAFFLRRLAVGDALHHGLLAIATAGALASPFLAARRWRNPTDSTTGPAREFTLAFVVFTILLFVPGAALHPDTLIPALALASLALLALRFPPRRRLARRTRHAADAGLCALIVLVVVQLPDLAAHAPAVIENHDFFLGPANDVLHGRAMLAGAWSQYGAGLIDALALTFVIVPIGFGTLALVIVALTTALYLCVYATLRLAGLGQALAMLAIAIAVAGNLFAPLDVYVSWPSDTPLRFGLPYLLVLCAVLAARYPARARAMRVVILVILGIAATWSFETFVYCAGTYGALVLMDAICAGTQVVRRIVRGAALGLAVGAAAAALLSLLTLLLAGSLDWGPYFEYIRLYSFEGFSQLPVVFFSAGPLMAAAIFSSAVLLLWLVRERPAALAPPMRAGLTGFTGLAVVTFTYYLGRSHPNNLLIILVPVVALGGLWTQVLLSAPAARWRTVAAAGIVLAGAMVAVAAWPSIEQKWRDTAMGLMVPGHAGSLSGSLSRLGSNPALDQRAPGGVALLANHLPPHVPALVLTESNLTTEILVRAGRSNLLPMSNPAEDVLIHSSRGRVLATAERTPAGTLLLTSPVTTKSEAGFSELQLAALAALHRRFAFQPVARTPEGLELVRLLPAGSS
jgi:hypothetical protein